MVEHFEMGVWLLFLAYVTSFTGAAIGLACTVHSRTATTQAVRMAWLVLAALSIGGVGVWLMHFIALLGFATPGSPIRYDVAKTLLSAVLAVGAVFGGLLVLGQRFVPWRLAVAGLVTGLAVILMHYTGMWAVNVRGTVDYQAGLVVLSVFIAVLAATAALWCAVRVDRLPMRLAAGAVRRPACTTWAWPPCPCGSTRPPLTRRASRCFPSSFPCSCSRRRPWRCRSWPCSPRTRTMTTIPQM
jgi:NO-binding membrane sensor protein with MHYT domain